MFKSNDMEDFYSDHLAQTNKKNKVVSTEDIYSNQGVLLIAKNTIIDEKVSFQLIKHKLKKSLSFSVSIENVLDEKDIYSATQEYFTEFPDIRYLHYRLDLNKSLQVGCLYFREFPLLRQKLTVMRHNLPALFAKAIAGGWYSLAIASQLQLDANESRQLFLAGLVRDVGMMHIAPSLLEQGNNDIDLTRKLIKGHVLVGKLVLDEVDGLPSLVKRAIFEHHERCDGAGYPKGKFGHQLSQGGLIVAMADTVQELLARYQQANRNISNLDGFLNLNLTTYSEAVYKAMVRLVRLSESMPARTVIDEEFEAFIENLLIINKMFTEICESLGKIIEPMESPQSQKEAIILKNFIYRILDIRVSSGVPSEEIARWMSYVLSKQHKDAYPEMEMIGMMFEELAWQMSQIASYLSVLWKQPVYSESLRHEMENCMLLIGRILKIEDLKIAKY